jgi:hypothetical protein
MIATVTHVVAETRSFERAELTLRHVLGHGPSAKTIERVTHQVGQELAARNAASRLEKEVVVPRWASYRATGAASGPAPRTLGLAFTRRPGARRRTLRLNG